MKVNYRTHPFLETIQKKTVLNKDCSFPIFKEDKSFFDDHGNMLYYLKSLELILSYGIESINYISTPFFLACEMAMEKLYPLVIDILNSKEEFNVSEIYLIRENIWMIDFHQKGKILYQNFFILSKDGEPCVYIISASGNKKGKDNGSLWVSKNFKFLDDIHDIHQPIFYLHFALILYCFKKYATVETKYLEPHSKIKEIGCKYINETKLPITYLDSKWFTNFVKSDAFAVRGHFRLQPKIKEGKWTHELIWINDFMKTGYTSPARKLSQ
jgi:hypothetical protein